MPFFCLAFLFYNCFFFQSFTWLYIKRQSSLDTISIMDPKLQSPLSVKAIEWNFHKANKQQTSSQLFSTVFEIPTRYITSFDKPQFPEEKEKLLMNNHSQHLRLSMGAKASEKSLFLESCYYFVSYIMYVYSIDCRITDNLPTFYAHK